jgi:hypothetical protein
MQYVERLPNPRAMIVPVVALAVGAAAATGTYALLDSDGVTIEPTKVIVAEAPSVPSQGVGAKDEAATAAAVGSQYHVPRQSTTTSFSGKDEASTAAAVGSQYHGSGNSLELRGSKAATPSQTSGARP